MAGGRKPPGVSGTGWRDIFSIGPPCIDSRWLARSQSIKSNSKEARERERIASERALGLAVGTAAAFGSLDYMKTTEMNVKEQRLLLNCDGKTTTAMSHQRNQFAAVSGRTDRASVCVCVCPPTSELKPHLFSVLFFSRPELRSCPDNSHSQLNGTLPAVLPRHRFKS